MSLPNSLYASKRTLTIENFQELYNKMNSIAQVPAHASVANVPSHVPIKIVPPSNAPPSNVAMSGNVAHVPDHASVANVPSNVKVNVVQSNSSKVPQLKPTPPSSCPLAPPVGEVNYCRPAPFQSSSGEKYFRVSDAYGSPTAS